MQTVKFNPTVHFEDKAHFAICGTMTNHLTSDKKAFKLNKGACKKCLQKLKGKPNVKTN